MKSLQVKAKAGKYAMKHNAKWSKVFTVQVIIKRKKKELTS